MRHSVFLFAVLLVNAAPTAAANSSDIDKTVTLLLKSCGAAGEKWEISGGASAGADISVIRRSASGQVAGKFNVSKSEVEGITAGVNSKLSAYDVQQAEGIRKCMEPFRAQIADRLLGPKQGMGQPKASRPLKSIPRKATQLMPPASLPRTVEGNDNEIHNNKGFPTLPTVKGDGNKVYDNLGTGQSQPREQQGASVEGDRNVVTSGVSDGDRALLQGNDNSLSHYSIIGGDPDKPLFRGNGVKVDGFIYAMAPKYFSAEESQRQFAILRPLRNEFLKGRGLSAELTDDDRIAEAAYLNQKLDVLKESFRVQFAPEMHALHTVTFHAP